VSAVIAVTATILAFAVGPEIYSASARIAAYGMFCAAVFAISFGVMTLRANVAAGIREARRHQMNEDD